MKARSYILAYFLPICTAIGFYMGGIGTYFGIFFLFVFTPLLDEIAGHEKTNPSKEEEKQRAANLLFDAWLWLWTPLQLALITWSLWTVSSGTLTTFELVGITLSTGIVTSGIGINVAHEFMHRPRAFERFLAEILMTSVSYTHFCIEHVYGHHRNVATPNDPASSRFGESFYRFLPRTLWGGLRSFWTIESARCKRKGIALWSLRNNRLRYPLVLGSVYAIIASTFGSSGVLYFAAQSLVAILLLEVINYVEHYGLERQEISPGRYERVLPKHSWNSTHRVTSLFLFNLPRHADHHYLANRPYYNLRHMEESPQLPAGYATMLAIAFIPPLWYRIMNHRAKEWNELSQHLKEPEVRETVSV